MKIVRFAIGLLASLIIGCQSHALLVAFTWAAIHGAGLSSVLALWPPLAALAIIWGGYVVLRRRPAIAFVAYAVAVVLTSEILLPGTPLKQWRVNRAISRVQVQNIRDEPFRTPQGLEIGVRITFDVVFGETGSYFVGNTVLAGADPGASYELIFDHMLPSTPSPAPRRASGDTVSAVFDRGVVYRFTLDVQPNFVEYDSKKPPCVRIRARTTFSEADFLNALSKHPPMRYRMDIEVSDPDHGGSPFEAASVVTTRPYDLQAIYQTVMSQGGGRCAL